MICKPRCRILGFSWSSSENSSTNAWNVNLNNGNVNTNTKSNINDNNRVRSFLSSKLARCSNTMIRLEDIYSAYYSCKRNKANTKQAIKFSLDLESNLIKLYNDIINKRYKIGPSIAFIVTRPKLREVFAANFRDRIVHHLLIDRLEPLFEQDFIEDSYSCRKGKGYTIWGLEIERKDSYNVRELH